MPLGAGSARPRKWPLPHSAKRKTCHPARAKIQAQTTSRLLDPPSEIRCSGISGSPGDQELPQGPPQPFLALFRPLQWPLCLPPGLVLLLPPPRAYFGQSSTDDWGLCLHAIPWERPVLPTPPWPGRSVRFPCMSHHYLKLACLFACLSF